MRFCRCEFIRAFKNEPLRFVFNVRINSHLQETLDQASALINTAEFLW
jgi:hypothetical protein